VPKDRAKGLYNGRPKTVDDAKVKELKEAGMGAVIKELGIGLASVYQPLNS
jgi:hypothetical protein